LKKEDLEKFPWLQEIVSESNLASKIEREIEFKIGLLKPDRDRAHYLHHASDLKVCERYLWFIWKGTVNQLDYTRIKSPSKLGVFDEGIDVEKRIVSKYATVGLLVPRSENYEVIIKDDSLRYLIVGHIDCIINDGTNENPVIVPVEIKTIKDWGETGPPYQYDAWKSLLPKLEHIFQITVYMKALGSPYGYIHYYNKNRSIEQVYKILFDERMWNECLNLFRRVEATLDKDSPPEIPSEFRRDKFPCATYSRAKRGNKRILVSKCQFYELCWGRKPPLRISAERKAKYNKR